ncbi:hypothetical protein MKW94_021119 [Papaver nudicaule]|uniref:Uncharacterized protein n=1 Tax=Papaver nudicaule TaxID=74823 RepID=A0AA42AYM0_PAPNU|nr:hypothetical protein [Papaver nudicaule]
MERWRDHNRRVLVEHTVEFEKGKQTSIAVHKYDDHYTKDTAFGITDIFLFNMENDSEDPMIEVIGNFREPYLDLSKDPVSGAEKPLFFIVGDILVPAKCVGKYQYQGLLLPNLPGEVDFFVSVNRMTPASQAIKLTFPKTKKSEIETELEEKLATLLVTDKSDCKKLIRKLKKCDNKKSHSERILREHLKEWLFDNCRTVNAINGKGHQVIQIFASLGYAWAIAIFKRFGFALDAKHATGWTPLHWAAYYGRKGAATALLVGRADPTLVTTPTSDYPNERTAADIAFERGHYHLAAYLADFIKRPEKRMCISTHQQ